MNKVQYSHFKWKYITTEHFNIYFNQQGRPVADFAAEAAEDAFRKITRSFRWQPEPSEVFTLITYQSHNDFQQTNVTTEAPSEGTGGFTEFLKNRIVIPYEGDYEKFRHVIHHELTHALMLSMLYGQGLGSILSGINQMRVPLWFTEGMAEYQSRGGLDRDSEMFLRDAVVNDLIPELRQLDQLGYLGVYKSGQAVIYWIAWRYGEEKIGELMHNLKRLRDFERALKASIGMDSDEMSKRWRQWMKERYWPQVANMNPPDRNTQRLTNHTKEFCFVNNSPALSPNGEYLAFLSDRSDYFDVYLMNTLDGKIIRRLVRGQRSGKFEELHWLRPGITWSPDGTRIAFCAKSGGKDALYIVRVKDGNIETAFEPESDGLFSPAWSPDGGRIAMVRVLNGRSDLVIYQIETGQLISLTDDLFDDADPSWSLDGSHLLFRSNRDGVESTDDGDYHTTLFGKDFHHSDIYSFNFDDSLIVRLTNDSIIEHMPIWTPIKNTILYVSDQSGAYNFYLMNTVTGERTCISNFVTGGVQPSISTTARSLAFASYYDNGYDIFIMNDPFTTVQPVEPYTAPAAPPVPPSGEDAVINQPSGDYSNFVFNRLLKGVHPTDSSNVPVDSIDSLDVANRKRDAEGKYPTRDYRVKLSPDLVYVYASYSPYFRAQGTGLLMFTDVLGNHQVLASVDLNRSTDNSNLYLNYTYLARRLNISQGFYHFVYPYYGNRVIWRDRQWGLFETAAYPLNRYNRFELGLDFMTVERSVWYHERATTPPNSSRRILMPQIGYVHDTSVWHAETEPGNGARWRMDFLWSPPVFRGGETLDFTTFAFDWRRYFNYRKEFSFAIRFSGAGSNGRAPQRFYLGGMMNWFNARYDNPQSNILVDSIEDVYFGSFITPIRGVGYYNKIGTRYLLGNLEFRFPFIKHLLFGWPLPFYFRNIRGALFTDYGTAWYPEDVGANLLPKKWTYGFGIGLRVNLGLFPLEYDIAWSPDPSSDMAPRHYVSINYGF